MGAEQVGGGIAVAGFDRPQDGVMFIEGSENPMANPQL
jgi:hypothetical protein